MEHVAERTSNRPVVRPPLTICHRYVSNGNPSCCLLAVEQYQNSRKQHETNQ